MPAVSPYSRLWNLLNLIVVEAFYTELSSFANYGPMYRRVQEYWLSVGEGGAMDALVEIRGNDTDIPKCVAS